jgi:hypothetical protein
MYQRILELRERILKKEHPDTIININNFALILRNQNKYEEVERMHR